jgi:hypothetical protein
MDFSENMLVQCRSNFPRLTLVRNDGDELPFRDQAFDAVLLFTVLTCIPRNDDQPVWVALETEVGDLLKPESTPGQHLVRFAQRPSAVCIKIRCNRPCGSMVGFPAK